MALYYTVVECHNVTSDVRVLGGLQQPLPPTVLNQGASGNKGLGGHLKQPVSKGLPSLEWLLSCHQLCHH